MEAKNEIVKLFFVFIFLIFTFNYKIVTLLTRFPRQTIENKMKTWHFVIKSENRQYFLKPNRL